MATYNGPLLAMHHAIKVIFSPDAKNPCKPSPSTSRD